MPRDSYEHEKRLRPASNQQQDEYHRLKNAACAALVRGIRSGRIGAACPDVTHALEDLADLMSRHPDRAFRSFRPEDLEETVVMGDPLCLR